MSDFPAWAAVGSKVAIITHSPYGIGQTVQLADVKRHTNTMIVVTNATGQTNYERKFRKNRNLEWEELGSADSPYRRTLVPAEAEEVNVIRRQRTRAAADNKIMHATKHFKPSIKGAEELIAELGEYITTMTALRNSEAEK